MTQTETQTDKLIHFKTGIYPLYKKIMLEEVQSWLRELVNTIAIPMTFFLAFGLGLREYIADVDGYPYMSFLAPGLITLTILLEAYRAGAWGMWLDRWHQGVIDEHRIKPIYAHDIIIGEICGGFTLALIKGALVAGVFMLLTPLEIQWMNLWPYLSYMVAGSILFTCVGTSIGTIFSKPDQIARTQTIIITPLLYIGGLFFPIESFPDEILPIIQWLPTTALFHGGRQALLAGTLDPFYLSVIWVTAIASFALGTWIFQTKVSE